MADLTEAIILAATMHKGQYDKGGLTYILHPLRVMLKASDDETRIVSMLHDIVEDTAMTLENLKELGFSERVVSAIDSLTKRDGETYPDFIQRVKSNELGTHVKLLDIEDNKDLTRIPNPTQKDFDRIAKYEKAESELKN
ncbi:GTP pyrophosphokinase [Candidatus Pristimantibacillus sp. PTI5]|uniref:GTP pyrophosphokinase n=1 Tax=Candidatus Pristimantibacillus sp. PTI5 TaxID=3400422 RepID=UPI003B023E73